MYLNSKVYTVTIKRISTTLHLELEVDVGGRKIEEKLLKQPKRVGPVYSGHEKLRFYSEKFFEGMY